MKYEAEITIDLPRQRVIELFDDPANLSQWQPGLLSFEHLSGERGYPGAKSRLVYEENNRKIEMIETVTSRNLPDEFSGVYEAKGVKNWISNRFYESGPEQTRWVTESEFKFSGIMAILSLFMRGSFSKQTQELMGRFKAFAEEAT